MKLLVLVSLLIAGPMAGFASVTVKGMNLTETDVYPYDANPTGAKTNAQVAVDEIKALGFNHIVLNPRAVMRDPRGNEVFPRTPVGQLSAERMRYKRLIDYIHSKGMTAGLRPIFFVVNKDGSTPFKERLAEGGEKIWWHGNIQPADPNAWFQSFKAYLDIYLLVGKLAKVDEFTIGAELYSMTVGIEDQWEAYPHGFPGRWNALLKYLRSKLGTSTRLMYDINFTDDRVGGGGLGATGGELERWRYRLVELGPPSDEGEREKWEKDPNQGPIWHELVEFWNGLDGVGIDMYRSLARSTDTIPTKYEDLVTLLKIKSDEYATQLDTMMVEIHMALESTSPPSGGVKPVMFKEVGYRSATNGFIDPFNYDSASEEVNIPHQAAAYEAFLRSFLEPKFEWLAGITLWDVAIDPTRKGSKDPGFSPVDKKATEAVIKKYLNR